MQPVDVISFPALVFSLDTMRVCVDRDELLTCGEAALRNGYFKEMLIVDHASRVFRVVGARKVRGVGLLGGFRLFASRRIRVDLQFASGSEQTDLETVRQQVKNVLAPPSPWRDIVNFEEVESALMAARSVGEIVDVLASVHSRSST